MKYLVVELSNREVWRIPASIIALNRAEYYVQRDIDCGDIDARDRDKVIKIEANMALKDLYEIIDWASNNMDWADVKSLGIKKYDDKEEPEDYHSLWQGASLNILEMDNDK